MCRVADTFVMDGSICVNMSLCFLHFALDHCHDSPSGSVLDISDSIRQEAGHADLETPYPALSCSNLQLLGVP